MVSPSSAASPPPPTSTAAAAKNDMNVVTMQDPEIFGKFKVKLKESGQPWGPGVLKVLDEFVEEENLVGITTDERRDQLRTAIDERDLLSFTEQLVESLAREIEVEEVFAEQKKTGARSPSSLAARIIRDAVPARYNSARTSIDSMAKRALEPFAERNGPTGAVDHREDKQQQRATILSPRHLRLKEGLRGLLFRMEKEEGAAGQRQTACCDDKKDDAVRAQARRLPFHTKISLESLERQQDEAIIFESRTTEDKVMAART